MGYEADIICLKGGIPCSQHWIHSLIFSSYVRNVCASERTCFCGLLVFLKELVFKKKLVFKRDFKNLLILQICKDPYLDCILSSSDR